MIGLILGFIFVKLIFNNNEGVVINIIKKSSLFIINKNIHHLLIYLVILFISNKI